MSEVQNLGADSDLVKSSKFNGFKAKSGEEYRVGFVYWNDDPGTMFKGVEAHYHNKYFACKSDKKAGKMAICCTHNYEKNKPTWRVGGVLAVYKIEDNKLKGYKLWPWMFSEAMFLKIKKANSSFPLSKHDVTLSLSPNTKEDYQTIEVHSCPESYWQLKPDLKKKIQDEAVFLMDEITRNLPQSYSIDDIKEILGIEESGSGDAAANIDLGDVLSEGM